MELSIKDRLILYNQYEILKELSEDEHDKREYETNQEILVQGYKYDYDHLARFIDNEVDEKVSVFVREVLALFRTLTYSYHELSEEDKKKVDYESIDFDGFDGNEEPEYYFYACFLIEKLNLYSEQSTQEKELNSHSNRVSIYQSMLERWHKERYGEHALLTAEQINAIVK